MRKEYAQDKIVWIDLESPSRAEVRELIEQYNLEPLIAEELLQPSSKARTELRSSYIYTIMHFPALRHTHKSREQEIDFIVGRNFVITTHYETIDPLHQFSKLFEVNSVLDRSNIGENASYMFFYMIKGMYKAVEHELEFIRRNHSEIQQRVFSGEEREMVEAISENARDLLNIRQTIEPHREVLQELESFGGTFFNPEFTPYLRALTNEYYRVHNHVMRHIDSLHELRETNNSLLSAKQNETMRMLTIMALLTFPLSLFVSIAGIASPHNPLRDMPYDFWVIVILVIVCALCMLWYFRKKRWI